MFNEEQSSFMGARPVKVALLGFQQELRLCRRLKIIKAFTSIDCFSSRPQGHAEYLKTRKEKLVEWDLQMGTQYKELRF